MAVKAYFERDSRLTGASLQARVTTRNVRLSVERLLNDLCGQCK